MTRPRIGIVGARRARGGLGPFVARDLQAAGADVVAFACTRAETVREAGAALAGVGVRGARGHEGLASMLADESLDALAILSPAPTHAACLEAALDAGLHVLCEKPFVWGMAEPEAAALRLVDAFAARGLVLQENCQWPFALPAFASLHPGVLGPGSLPKRFAMRLSPSGIGAAMLVDVLPHPLSLLQELSANAAARIETLRFSTRDPACPRLRVEFAYATPAQTLQVDVQLVGRSAPPREVWLSIDGHPARRSVRPSDYALALEAEGRVVPLPDPMARLVAGFVAAITALAPGARQPRAAGIAARMALLCRIVDEFEQGGT